jgi:membrane-associated phospholipid phosphatase
MKATIFLLFLLVPGLAGAQSPASLPAPAPLPTEQDLNMGENARPENITGNPPASPPGLSPVLPADSLPSRPANSRHQLMRKMAIPLTLIAAGFAGSGRNPLIGYNEGIHEEIQEHYHCFNTKVDNYTRNVPIAAVYALNLAGIKGRHDLYNLTAVFLLADFINSSATMKLKGLTHQLRPDRSSADAFPSGHTSGAFTAATVLYLEYKDQSIWYGVGGYGIAAATGGLRMLKNKHWLSDVLAGAGVGILSTQVAYAVYPWIQKKISQGLPRRASQRFLILPGYAHKTAGINLLYTLK